MERTTGVDEVTLMDSAGTMLPDEVAEYISEMVKTAKIDIGYHSHSNLGLSPANALAAVEAGAATVDTCLLGMARSAGNLSTESTVAVFQRKGMLKEINFLNLMHFLDEKLSPALEEFGYHPPVLPIDTVFGAAGCHSSFSGMFMSVAMDKKVDLFDLILRVSAIDRKDPTKELTESVADSMASS
jgi:4-hydroxy 2-oxovalerate aldolase